MNLSIGFLEYKDNRYTINPPIKGKIVKEDDLYVFEYPYLNIHVFHEQKGEILNEIAEYIDYAYNGFVINADGDDFTPDAEQLRQNLIKSVRRI